MTIELLRLDTPMEYTKNIYSKDLVQNTIVNLRSRGEFMFLTIKIEELGQYYMDIEISPDSIGFVDNIRIEDDRLLGDIKVVEEKYFDILDKYEFSMTSFGHIDDKTDVITKWVPSHVSMVKKR